MKAQKSKTQSMTGYGRHSANSNGYQIEIELKSLNSRYLDISIKMPKEYTSHEKTVRGLLENMFQRGRIELSVTRRPTQDVKPTASINLPVLQAYLDAYRGLRELLGLKNKRLNEEILQDLLFKKEIVDLESDSSPGSKEIGVFVLAVEEALKRLKFDREQEGHKLAKESLSYSKELNEFLAQAKKRAKAYPAQAKKILAKRLKDLGVKAKDSGVLIAEAAQIAEKADVSEELSRIRFHLDSLEEEFRFKASGKRLEFLLQELGRETNTIAAKSGTAALQGLVVNAKATLEKLREQAQNIE